MFSGVFRRAVSAPALPRGARVYAIGDIHGRLDLFLELIQKIDDDLRNHRKRGVRCIVLGDFIDRGPDSARLIELLMTNPGRDLIVLKGNHEATLNDALLGDHDAMEMWIQYGGLATLQSFGVALDALDLDDTQTLIDAARAAIPKSVVAWLAQLPSSYRLGSYYFVHGGVQPGVALHRQVERDQLWIRERFTDDTRDHGAVVVHGHTIAEAVVFAANRIGLDTGAYRTGRLSALGLDGQMQWVIETVPSHAPS